MIHSHSTKRVAVGGVEDRRHARTALVAVRMELRREGASVGALLLASPQLLVYGRGKQLLGLDLGHLHVAVRIAVEEELRADEVREVGERGPVLRGQHLQHRRLGGPHIGVRQLVVDLRDEGVELGDELDEALREDDDAVVLDNIN